MPPVGKRDEVTQRAMTRLGTIENKTLSPTGDAKTDCLDAAIDWYDRLRPRASTYEVAGDNVKRRFVLSTDVAGWAKGSSLAGPVQFVTDPDTDDEKILDLDLNEWDQRRSSAGDDVLMLAAPVPTGTTLRVLWTAAHVVHAIDAALTTIPDRDADAFVSMMAALMARWVSRRASDIAAANLGADQIDAEPIGTRWAKRASELEKQALDRLAPKSESVSAAGASIDWENENTTARQPRVGH